jgi:selenoprotein W-related protein
VSLAEAVLDEFGQDVKELTLIPSRGGVFEVTVNGRLVFSKKQTGRHPSLDEVRKLLREK